MLKYKSSWISFKSIFFILIIIFIVFYFILQNFSKTDREKNQKQEGMMEHFEDKMSNMPDEADFFDKEFVDFYEIIYRDYYDIDKDHKLFMDKTINPMADKKEANICVIGSGVGKVCKKIKDESLPVVGIDKSTQMLKKAQILYPHIKFYKADMVLPNLFPNESFSHAFVDERTLYYNKPDDIDKILININEMLKPKGFLLMQVFNPKKLKLACRYYSSNYIDDKGNLHGFTYLNDFTHDCYYLKNGSEENSSEKNSFSYYDKIILENGNKRIKRTPFYIPDKEEMYEKVLKSGFEVFHIEPPKHQILGEYEFAIFRKKPTLTTVDELQGEKNQIK